MHVAAALDESSTWRKALDAFRNEAKGEMERSIRIESGIIQGEIQRCITNQSDVFNCRLLERDSFLEGRFEELKSTSSGGEFIQEEMERCVRNESERVHARMLERYSFLEGRFEELKESMFPDCARCRETERSSLQLSSESQATTEKLTRKIPELQRLCCDLEQRFKALRQEQNVNDTITEKLTCKIPELQRLCCNLDQRFKDYRQEQNVTDARLAKSLDATETNTEQANADHAELVRRCDGLTQELQVQQTSAMLSQEEATASAKLNMDQACATLEKALSKGAAESASKAITSARGFAIDVQDALSHRLVALLTRVDTCEALTKDGTTKLEASVRGGDNKLKNAMDGMSQQLEGLRSEFHEDSQSTRRAATEACHELSKHFSKQFEHQQLESEEHAQNMRAEFQRGLAGMPELRRDFAVARDELFSNLEGHAEKFRQASSTHEAQLCQNIIALKTDFSVELASQARRITQIDNGTAEKLGNAADEIQETLQNHAQKVCETRACLDADMRRLVAEAEGRLRSIFDSESIRFAEFLSSLDRLRAENLLSQQQQLAMTASIQELAESAKEEASQAKSQVVMLETTMQMCAHSGCQIQDNEAKDPGASIKDIQTAVGSLTSGLMKIAQCCGLIGGLEERNEEGSLAPTQYLLAECVGIQELLEWERSGSPLVARIEQSWNARASARARTLLELIQQKADEHAVQFIQACMRDLEKRVFATRNLPLNIPHWREVYNLESVRSGEPYVGAFGARGHHRNSHDGADRPSAALHVRADACSTPPTTASCASLFSPQQQSRSGSWNTSMPAEGHINAVAGDPFAGDPAFRIPQPPMERPSGASPHRRSIGETTPIRSS